MSIPRPSDVAQVDRNSPGYRNIKAEVTTWLGQQQGWTSGERSGGESFYGRTWPSDADLKAMTEDLRAQGWNASFENVGIHDRAVCWTISPAVAPSQAPRTPKPKVDLGPGWDTMGIPPLGTSAFTAPTLNPEAQEWLTTVRSQLLSGQYGPEVQGGALQIPYLLPHPDEKQARQNINTVLLAAGWNAQFGHRYLTLWKETHTHLSSRRRKPFGFEFPTPEEVNQAIFRARAQSRMGTSSRSGGGFVDPDTVAENRRL